MPKRILVVEDEVVLNRTLVQHLLREGYVAEGARSAAEARKALEDGWDLLLLDLRLPDSQGLSLLREVRETVEDQVCIVMTAYSSIEDAVEAIRLGASDYLKKPFEVPELLVRVRRALEVSALKREIDATRGKTRSGIETVLGNTAAMHEIHELVRRVAASEASTVLITGESGSGKDMVAKAIHGESRRASGPFMTITCTAISEQLLESELFGHEKGSFTNATSQKKGLFELADGGTVFLDEIGDLSPALQAKLLRFLQEKTFKRVGGTRDIKVDARIVAATHQPLPTLVEQGKFRQDLYYRLKVVDIVVPPLRARREDVPLLVRAFIEEYNRAMKRSVEFVDPEALARLCAYPWPGNVRELKNAIERAMILGHGSTIHLVDLPGELRAIEVTPDEVASASALAGFAPPPAEAPEAPAAPATPAPGAPASAPAPVAAAVVQGDPYRLPPGGVDLDKLERELLQQAITRAKGNRTQAGRLLGLNRDQVRYRLEKYGLIETEKES